ncbi:hypothetical protein PMAYCL1PPCAC_20226 [Pristionchus mayeri]|uniref:F-box domain-containing protein n=1 Tax=Pristionchus mayeri TaxID=1317129 RepID=A0AAN5CSK1_9BILA|nr:hypothetical protein PMAYCL1PPCAC_20226 [Pristionchus mayeri]
MEDTAILTSDINAIEAKHDAGSTPIEGLPCELLWEIFNKTPESISNIRLISRAMKSAADKFILRRISSRIVDNITFHFERCFWKEFDYLTEGRMRISINVDNRFKNLFELRYKLRQPSIQMERWFNRHDELEYWLDFHLVEDKDQLKILEEIMGRHIGKVVLMIYGGYAEFDEEKASIVYSFIQDVHFKNLECKCYDLSEDIFTYVLSIMDNRNLSNLILDVDEVRLNDPVACLLRLSSLQKSITITQNNVDYRSEDGAYHEDITLFFFGKKRFNWAPTFVEMMKRTCETLIIKSEYYSFLRKNHADLLREQLPQLNKKIWFRSSCHSYKAMEYMENEHVVKYDKSVKYYDRFLSVKHLSRLDERH